MKEKDILLRFYEATGNNTESLVFLKKFRSKSSEKFSVLYTSTDTIAEFLEKLFYDLKFLYRLDLFPVIAIHIESLEYIKLFYRSFYDRIRELKDKEEFSIELIHYKQPILKQVQDVISRSSIPMVVFDKPAGSIYETLFEIVDELESEKLVILDKEGGFRKLESGEKVSIINLTNEYHSLLESNVLSKDNTIVLEKVNILINRLKNTNPSVAVTSPLTLFQELFTVKGSGTYIKKGSTVDIYSGVEPLDRIKLVHLLETAFHKTILPAFFTFDICSVIIESNYKGAAIMKRSPYGEYLTKFAVDEIARGEGIGRDIWDKMKSIYHSFFWRAKPYNPINKWYSKECTGMHKAEKWTIFWVNKEPKDIDGICKFMNSEPPDFLE